MHSCFCASDSVWINIFKDSCQPISQLLCFLQVCWLQISLHVPCIPNRGRPFSPSYPPHRRPSPRCLSASATAVLRVHSVSPSSPVSLPASPSLSPSLMSCDRYGRRGSGVGGTCLSKTAVENEGSDEGGMLCILNACNSVRGGGRGGMGWGKYQ